jgi:predicted nucleic acid-binding protein
VILADTSVWIDHLRRGNSQLRSLLDAEEVACHPFVVGELACGNLRNRSELLRLLRHLPNIGSVNHEEAMHFLESHRLAGRGLGWIDIHLLSSTTVAAGRLFTLDTRLAKAAAMLGCGV